MSERLSSSFRKGPAVFGPAAATRPSNYRNTPATKQAIPLFEPPVDGGHNGVKRQKWRRL